MDLRVVLVFSTLVLAAAKHSAPPPSPSPSPSPSPESCSDELVRFSPCLPYISSFPNNITDSPPSKCCGEVASAFVSGNAVCLCYFVQRPRILGFPVNFTRVVSLASVCSIRNRNGISNFSVSSLCLGKATLPPLKSISGPGNSPPNPSGQNNAPPPQISTPQKPKNRSSRLPPPEDSSVEPAADSPTGPDADSSTGHDAGSPVKPAADSSTGHVIDSPTVPITPVTPTGASTVRKICIICLLLSLGNYMLFVDIFK